MAMNFYSKAFPGLGGAILFGLLLWSPSAKWNVICSRSRNSFFIRSLFQRKFWSRPKRDTNITVNHDYRRRHPEWGIPFVQWHNPTLSTYVFHNWTHISHTFPPSDGPTGGRSPTDHVFRSVGLDFGTVQKGPIASSAWTWSAIRNAAKSSPMSLWASSRGNESGRVLSSKLVISAKK